MSFMKDLYIDAYERLYWESEELGLPVDESNLGEKAYEAMRDKLADMADAAKERVKNDQ